MSKVWSPYSLALYDTWRDTDNNIIVQACPGAGKTTNIEHICRELIKPGEKTAYLAFGAALVKEAKERLPEHMSSNIMTLNGLGHRAIMKEFGKVKLDNDKVFKISRDICKQGRLETRTEYNERLGEINKGVGLAKVNTCDSEEDFVELCDTYDVTFHPGLYYDLQAILQRNDNMTDVIDFNDQLRFPVLFGLPMPQFDNILCDEVQDFSRLQLQMLKSIYGRFGFVGDKHQGIFGFRGAMSDSMETIKYNFDCVELPLKLSYRCSKAVVAEAAKLFPDIEALESAPDGSVTIGQNGAQLTNKDMVLCRLNSPLITYAYALLRSGVPCYVKGRVIGSGLTKLINKLQCNTVAQLIDSLEQWRTTEVYKAILKGNELKASQINDRATSIEVFTAQCRTTDNVECVTKKIEALFDNGNGVMLSTVHKAKGLEADNAYILQSDLMPLQWATKPWEREQEQHIKYVAITRARHNLIYM
jgi:superfamily I DNA/RNA helicase